MIKTCETCKYEKEPETHEACKNCMERPDGNTKWVDKNHKFRIKNAQAAQSGACNPIPISKALHDAILEVRAEGGDATKDAAVYLILHQLTFLLTGHDFAEPSTYSRAMQEIGS